MAARKKLGRDWDAILRDAIERGLTVDFVAWSLGCLPAEVTQATRAKSRYGWAKSIPFDSEGINRPAFMDGKAAPKSPSRLLRGEYDPKDFLRYLSEARELRMRDDEIADHLCVERHRVLYLINGGLSVIERRV